MPSHLGVIPRRIPQQERGERRVATLLEAAASVVAECGYEAATMNGIAERAGAAIGSLYQFFPNKQVLIQALRAQYGVEIAESWAPLEAQAKCLSLERLVDRLMDVTIAFVDHHPAFLPLLDAPSSTRNPPIRKRLIELLARLFARQKPRLSKVKAARLAMVTLHIMKALSSAYAEVHAKEERTRLVREFKAVLLRYLTLRMGD